MRLPEIRHCLPAALALLAGVAAHGQPPSPAGLYRAQAGPDTVAMIELAPDGRFRYQLSEGALDEQAGGRWTQTDKDTVTLQTLPRPRAPVWEMQPIGEAVETPFSLLVTVPGANGAGIAGIDFRIGFANGDVKASYTQGYGWQMAPDDTRKPVWLELVEPIHGAVSPRFALPEQANIAVTILVTPNDIGIANFDGTTVSMKADGLVLHWRERDITFARAGKTRPTP